MKKYYESKYIKNDHIKKEKVEICSVEKQKYIQHIKNKKKY